MTPVHTGKKQPVWGGILIGIGSILILVALFGERAFGAPGFVSVCLGASMFRPLWGKPDSVGQPPMPGHLPPNFSVQPGYPHAPYQQPYPQVPGAYQQQYPQAPGHYPPNYGQYPGHPQQPGSYGHPPQQQYSGPHY